MILRNQLYSVSKYIPIDDGGVKAHIVLCAGHTIYKAHFPGQPITPGACLIQMARELMEDYSGLHLQLSGVKNAKFLNVISPLETPELLFHMKPRGTGSLSIQVVVMWESETFAKMTLDFTDNEH